MTMTNLTLKAAALMGMVLLGAPMAMAQGGDVDAATQAKITGAMTAQGYDVRKMEMEDGLLEVYAVKDGQTFQMFYDAKLTLVKTCGDNGCTDGSTAEGGEATNG